ncbi:MAG: ATP-binding cassette domain-containing protein [Treponema sp.]|nr:ATP-binding cassette domain-containing protein [Treponema sp.]MBR0101814.1 ATP-binding cassette domain-containing protein [Treponema sp.]
MSQLVVRIEKNLVDFFLRADFETDSNPLAVLGESGAGKSMLLKCVAGIETPDSGKIILNGVPLFDSEKRINLPPQKRRVGYLFQNYALFPNMNVYKNISSTAKNKDAAAFYIKRFALCGKEKFFPNQLSGGEQQRVALARLLASEPDVLLFDEPFSALDSNRKSELERMILDLLEEKKCPSILVTHDRNEAFRLSEKIAVMEKGHLLEPQDKHDFFENPKTLCSALLSGCKNISRLEWIDENTAFASEWGIKIRVAEKNHNKPPYAGFRAHYLVQTNAPFESDENIFSCCIKRVIEDAFSFIIYFTQNTYSEQEKLISWEVEKELWKKIEKFLPSNPLFLKIESEKIMLLE